jgi:hypothetical protein
MHIQTMVPIELRQNVIHHNTKIYMTESKTGPALQKVLQLLELHLRSCQGVHKAPMHPLASMAGT